MKVKKLRKFEVNGRVNIDVFSSLAVLNGIIYIDDSYYLYDHLFNSIKCKPDYIKDSLEELIKLGALVERDTTAKICYIS